MSDLEKRVDSLIGEFDDWFQTRGNEPLVRSERAAIKTFLWFLTHLPRETVMPELHRRKDGDEEDNG